MTYIPFEYLDRRRPATAIDSTSDLFEAHEGPSRDLNPFRSLPTVQELRRRLNEHGNVAVDSSPRMAAVDVGVYIGVDVARFGSDSTSICVRRGASVIFLDTYRKEDTMTTAGRVAAAIREFSPDAVYIDEIGIGAGVVDRLKELRFHMVKGVNCSGRARDPATYANLRAEMFDQLRQRFERGDIQLPRDPELAEQLASLRFSFTSAGQIQLESKESMARRGLRSPDKADALALAFSARRHQLRARL